MRGCSAALVMGASKRTVCRRSPSIVSAAEADKSQMMAFQSRDAVRRYRELPDQLRVKVPGQLGVRKALPHTCVSFARARCRPRVQRLARTRSRHPEEEEELHSPNRRDSLDMPFEPAHDAARLKVEHRDVAVLPAYGEVVPCEEAPRVEARAGGRGVDRRVKVLRKRGREGVCGRFLGQQGGARTLRRRWGVEEGGQTEELEVHLAWFQGADGLVGSTAAPQSALWLPSGAFW